MKSNIVARKYEVTSDIRDRLEKKLAKLDRFFSEETGATVTFSSKRGRDNVEITIFYKSMTYRAEVYETDVISGIDKAVDIIERQIRKNKTKLEKRLRDNAFEIAPDEEMGNVPEEAITITRNKHIELMPMSTEEAVLQMNLISHDFFVFRNEKDAKVNIVYKRYDGGYGLLEVE
ncbi:MAG: ribosome-associated translation inhibitor RaiA [Clostridia bacterium]|nr:ribosome-associated translation inhibitor RaiA [Clostridia bacterium]